MDALYNEYTVYDSFFAFQGFSFSLGLCSFLNCLQISGFTTRKRFRARKHPGSPSRHGSGGGLYRLAAGTNASMLGSRDTAK